MKICIVFLALLPVISVVLNGNFIGNEHWDAEILEMCDDLELDDFWSTSDALCYTYIEKFQRVSLEVLSWFPALVIYRDLIKPAQISNFVADFENSQKSRQTVHEPDGTRRESTSRRAVGSFSEHFESEAVISVFQTVSSLIPAIDFEMSEPFSTLLYEPGGHYAPHFDYLTFETDELDYYSETMGSRMATLIITLKTADSGGGTVFPNLKTTVRPRSGDAYLWFNMGSDGMRDDLSLHGGCPIYVGQKIISTLWIHERNQKIPPEASTDYPIPADFLIPALSARMKI